MTRRVLYAGSVHDEAEIDACVEVLRVRADRVPDRAAGARSSRSGWQRCSASAAGIAVNSGSSALYLAVELLAPAAGLRGADLGADVLHRRRRAGPSRTGPGVRRRRAATPTTSTSTPWSALIGPTDPGDAHPEPDRQRAGLGPPASLADRHGLLVIEDSCDALGATLRGTPTGTRSDLTVTSFAASHIITAAGNGGMVLLDDEALRDRGLLLRRWGRDERGAVLRVTQGRRSVPRRGRRDGVRQPVRVLRAGLELRAVRARRCVRTGAARQAAATTRLRRGRTTSPLPGRFSALPDWFVPPVQLEGLDTAWLAYPFVLVPGRSRSTGPNSSSAWRPAGSTPAWCGPATSPVSR